jgi:hypothetical protein
MNDSTAPVRTWRIAPSVPVAVGVFIASLVVFVGLGIVVRHRVRRLFHQWRASVPRCGDPAAPGARTRSSGTGAPTCSAFARSAGPGRSPVPRTLPTPHAERSDSPPDARPGPGVDRRRLSRDLRPFWCSCVPVGMTSSELVPLRIRASKYCRIGEVRPSRPFRAGRLKRSRPRSSAPAEGHQTNPELGPQGALR